MTRINTNSFCRRSTVSSAFFPDTRETIVSVIGIDGKEYRGKTKWNPADPFDPQIGFKIALERAIANMPKPTIIEQCGGLRNGDWVCVKASKLDFLPLTWGLVCDNFIYYMTNSKGFDPISIFKEKGDTGNSKIIQVIRSESHPITFGYITHLLANPASIDRKDIEIYTTA